jgi:hypothetical protein|tara:strand:- start:17 stop:202 length:186 start_codon:yes stop_codon:yes gene_type:complete
MNKQELKEQLQENLLAYFDGYPPIQEHILDGMCEVVINTIDDIDHQDRLDKASEEGSTEFQ